MFEQFKNKYLGKTVDVDGMYGGQCVDLFNAWNRDYNGTYINCQPSGYARSIAENKKNNGILKYFQETAVNNMIPGTVVVYGICDFAPVSHVCFFIKDNGNGTYQALQQNTNNRQYVTIDNNPYNGIIGAFIPNQILEEKKKKEPKTEAPTTPPVDEDKVKITELQKRVDELEYQIDNLNAIQDVLEEENSKLKEQLANQPELIFKAPRTDYYAIKLEENQQLYLK